MSFDFRTHETGSKRTAPNKETWHGVVWDKTGKRKKNVWTCPHRHRDEWLARNCASEQLSYEVKKMRLADWDAATLEIIPPEHFYERWGQEGEAFRTTLCKVCHQFPDHERHLPRLVTDLKIDPGHLDEFARWVGPKMGFVGRRGGIYFSGGLACKAWIDLVFKLGFVQDYASMEPGQTHAKWRQRRRGDSVDHHGNIIATQISARVIA